MKEISIRVYSIFKVEGAALNPKPCDPIIKDHFEDVVVCRKNAGKVIWGTLSIELKLDDIIKSHLFEHDTEKTDFFMSHFLKTNRIDFSSKRQIALSALKDSNQLTGKKYSKLEKLLSDINKKRNAFAHGNIYESTEHGIVLEYFEGCKKSDILTDEYWTAIEDLFRDVNEILNKI